MQNFKVLFCRMSAFESRHAVPNQFKELARLLKSPRKVNNSKLSQIELGFRNVKVPKLSPI